MAALSKSFSTEVQRAHFFLIGIFSFDLFPSLCWALSVVCDSSGTTTSWKCGISDGIGDMSASRTKLSKMQASLILVVWFWKEFSLQADVSLDADLSSLVLQSKGRRQLRLPEEAVSGDLIKLMGTGVNEAIETTFVVLPSAL